MLCLGTKLLLGHQPYTRVLGRVALKVLSFSLSPLSQDKPAFRDVISQLERDPKCKGLSFSSFLILPFQRITRLKLLVQVEFCSSLSHKGLLDHSWNFPFQ